MSFEFFAGRSYLPSQNYNLQFQLDLDFNQEVPQHEKIFYEGNHEEVDFFNLKITESGFFTIKQEQKAELDSYNAAKFKLEVEENCFKALSPKMIDPLRAGISSEDSQVLSVSFKSDIGNTIEEIKDEKRTTNAEIGESRIGRRPIYTGLDKRKDVVLKTLLRSIRTFISNDFNFYLKYGKEIDGEDLSPQNPI